MKRHPIFFGLWVAINALLLAALAVCGYGVWWEHSTRRYLAGFVDAVVPGAAPPQEKAQAILNWMKSGPQRQFLDEDGVSLRDPENTLNYQELLRVCGTATNAFVNLATSSGLEARRLLLLNEDRVAKHVTAEVRLESHWVVVDPLFRTFLRDAAGRPVSKERLRDPAVFREVIAQIPGYPPEYSFEHTSHVRLSRIPVVGRPLRRLLDRVLPGWDSASIWTLLLERESLAFTLGSGLLVMLALGLRWVLSLYCERRLGVVRMRSRDRLAGVWTALFRGPA